MVAPPQAVSVGAREIPIGWSWLDWVSLHTVVAAHVAVGRISLR